MKLKSILLILITNCCIVSAQKNPVKNKLFTEFACHYGFVMPHHDYMSYFVNKHVQAFQFNIGIAALGEKKWHKYFNYPKYGLGFYHSGLGNDAIFGKMNALYFFYDRLYLDNKHRFNFGNRIAFGLSYINKRYDLYNNPFDMVIGSRLNVYINYSIEGDIRISPLLHCKLGLGMSHASNGNFKEPNKGINLITSFVSLQYKLKDHTQYQINDDIEEKESGKNKFLITGAFGWKSISRFRPYYYAVYAISGEYLRRLNYTNALGLALNTYIDRSLRKERETDIENPDSLFHTMDYVRLALNLSYELKMGKVAYLIQPGIYIKNIYKKPGIITNRIGLRYYFNTNWAASVMVKAHWLAIADVVEWGVGYRIGN